MFSEVPLILASKLLAIRREKCTISLSKDKIIVFKKENARICQVSTAKYYVALVLLDNNFLAYILPFGSIKP